jgi:hypothetical protein
MTSNNSHIPSTYLCYGHAHSQTSSIRMFAAFFHRDHTLSCLFLFTHSSLGIFPTHIRQHSNRKSRLSISNPSLLPATYDSLFLALHAMATPSIINLLHLTMAGASRNWRGGRSGMSWPPGRLPARWLRSFPVDCVRRMSVVGWPVVRGFRSTRTGRDQPSTE